MALFVYTRGNEMLSDVHERFNILVWIFYEQDSVFVSV